MAEPSNLIQTCATFAKTLAEAAYHVEYGDEIEDITMWFQSWPNTACGHGGVAGQAFTTGMVVAITTVNGRALFFSQGRLLHNREHDRTTAMAIHNRQVPGKGGRWPEVDP